MFLPIAQNTTGGGLGETLRWVAAGGALIIVSWFASWYLERLAWWQALRSETRSLIILGLSFGIGAGALVIMSLGPETLEKLRPWGEMALAVMGAWLATQTAHNINGARKDGRTGTGGKG